MGATWAVFTHKQATGGLSFSTQLNSLTRHSPLQLFTTGSTHPRAGASPRFPAFTTFSRPFAGVLGNQVSNELATTSPPCVFGVFANDRMEHSRSCRRRLSAPSTGMADTLLSGTDKIVPWLREVSKVPVKERRGEVVAFGNGYRVRFLKDSSIFYALDGGERPGRWIKMTKKKVLAGELSEILGAHSAAGVRGAAQRRSQRATVASEDDEDRRLQELEEARSRWAAEVAASARSGHPQVEDEGDEASEQDFEEVEVEAHAVGVDDEMLHQTKEAIDEAQNKLVWIQTSAIVKAARLNACDLNTQQGFIGAHRAMDPDDIRLVATLSSAVSAASRLCEEYEETLQTHERELEELRVRHKEALCPMRTKLEAEQLKLSNAIRSAGFQDYAADDSAGA